MTWQQILRNHDPIEPLTADETAAIRRGVVAEAIRTKTSPAPVRRLAPVWVLGGTLTAAAVAGILVARTHPPAPVADPVPAASGDMRQLQFSTPGGTRIIWQFNPDFSLQGMTP